MEAITTPAEMAIADASAPASTAELVRRAGWAVARRALHMLGGGYGRRVVVLAGPGNNGADGRDAAARLRRRGVSVTVIDARDSPAALGPADLVIDAAYGTGLNREYRAPVMDARVLAVDIPSGVDGLTGEVRGRAEQAEVTVSFASFKPGHLMGAGQFLSGDIEIVDIGVPVGTSVAGVVGGDDVGAWVPARPRSAHKWTAAVRIVAGSPAMAGAATLVSGAALRGGAGMVVTTVPGSRPVGVGIEIVQVPLAVDVLVDGVIRDIGRFGCLVVGPGLGRRPEILAAVSELVARADVPLVLDADGLAVVETEPGIIRARSAPTVLTPHDGEFKRLTGRAPESDRMAAVRRLAGELECHVLLKGPVTFVADPHGRVLVSRRGDQRLATAGTGDVLAGLIGSFMARGIPPCEAAACGAFVHGEAGRRLAPAGGVAGDLLGLVGQVLGEMETAR